MRVTDRAVSAGDGVGERNLRLRQKRRQSGDGNDRHPRDKRIHDWLQFRPFQSEVDASSRFGHNTVGRHQCHGPRRRQDSARASPSGRGYEDRRIDDQRARRRLHGIWLGGERRRLDRSVDGIDRTVRR
jgi:hypothetical protein